MTRSVPPRTRVVAKVCLRTWAVVLSSRPAPVGDAGDDGVCSPDAEAPALLVEEQGGTVLRAGPVDAFVEPAGEGAAELGVDGDLSGPFPFAVDADDALAGREADVVDVEGDDLGDTGAGVEREEGQGLVSGRRAGGDGSQEPDLGPLVEGSGGGVGDLDAGGGGWAEASAGVEVVHRGEGVVYGCRLGLGHGLEVGAVVAHGPVTAVGAVEGFTVDVCGCEPRQVTGGPWRRRFAGSGRPAEQPPRWRCRRRARPRTAQPARPGHARGVAGQGGSRSLKQVRGLVGSPGACSLKPRREVASPRIRG